MRSKRSILTCDRGFTIVELLVASGIGMVIMALAISGILANREVYHFDMVRTRLNQNLRGALDLVGTNAREAGESLAGSFAAVEIINGAVGVSDQLVLRRNLLDEVLKVCTAITAGSGVATVTFADASATPGCSYSGNTHNYTTWRTYRLDNGPTVKAYIYNTVTKQGEFFDYVSETDTGAIYRITRSAGTWTNAYPVGAASVYMLEEWHFQVQDFAIEDDLLQVIQNDDVAAPLNVLSAVINFQVQAFMADGTVKTTFNPIAGDQWINIEAIELTLSGQDTTIKNEVIDSSISARFFPRNVLSN